MLTKRNKSERMTIVNTLLTGIYEELLKGETDDINGLLQIAVYAQVEMNRIVDRLNQLNGCEPQTDCETCKYGEDKHRYAHICNECGVGINNYTPQTDCGWK